MHYQEWLNEWLENYIKPTSKQRTYLRYAEAVRLHIAPWLGEYEIDSLTVDVLQKFVTNLLCCGNLKTRMGLSSNTVCSIINILQNSLKTANYLGLSKNYVADKIKRPPKEEREITCFTLEEQKAIEKAVSDSPKKKLYGIVLCFYTGLRIGELLALGWSDIDLNRGVMRVTKSCHDGKDNDGKYMKVIETPKTRSSKREIPLPKQLIPQIKRMEKSRDSDFVISANGRGVSVRSYQRSFDLLLKRLKIKHRGFHSLRHSFATRALECGMDVKTLSELLGHKSPTITLNRYAHSLMEHKQDMMNRLGKLL